MTTMKDAMQEDSDHMLATAYLTVIQMAPACLSMPGQQPDDEQSDVLYARQQWALFWNPNPWRQP